MHQRSASCRVGNIPWNKFRLVPNHDLDQPSTEPKLCLKYASKSALWITRILTQYMVSGRPKDRSWNNLKDRLKITIGQFEIGRRTGLKKKVQNVIDPSLRKALKQCKNMLSKSASKGCQSSPQEQIYSATENSLRIVSKGALKLFASEGQKSDIRFWSDLRNRSLTGHREVPERTIN